LKYLGWTLDIYHKPSQIVVLLIRSEGRRGRLTDKWNPKTDVSAGFCDLPDQASKPFVKQCKFVEKYENSGDLEKSRVLEI
jgi:hypothetical protein